MVFCSWLTGPYLYCVLQLFFLNLLSNQYIDARPVHSLIHMYNTFGSYYDHTLITERPGFEPGIPHGTTVFETAPFSHSGTSPGKAVNNQ